MFFFAVSCAIVESISISMQVVTLERVERMMAKPAGRPSRENVNLSASPTVPERLSEATQEVSDECLARLSIVDMDNDMIALVVEQEIENLKWAGPSKEHVVAEDTDA